MLLALGCALGLASCAPTITPTAPPAPVIDSGGADLRLDMQSGAQVISFKAGAQAALATTLTLTGNGLAVNDKSCTAQGQQIVCTLPTISATKTYVLPSRGVSKVTASYSRADGKTYTLTAP
ncbi:hypothetical protein EHF33_20410 (plasmid) [Deinococcus psychrotolerans]|uniref:IPT/TIG domain-containing protein n=1 Tax=Deinococcus psychrotolerans TaxID=2489213 RepID=A0A3G8YVS1_9DEIO|nr:hypothetical protein [Deinococcus psychrotolerans]AZI45276.1 hypothetical protein EHF33_20410 [Deinococcus psychrotolerans]